MLGARLRRLAGCVVAALLCGCSFDPSVSEADPPDAGPPPACALNPDYAVRAGSDHTYRFLAARMPYDDGYATCARDGAHMVVIDDPTENAFVTATITANAWIGLDDLTVEGEFSWADGTPLGAINEFRVSTNEPTGGLNQDCVMIFHSGNSEPGTWNDAGCGSVQEVVCECDRGFAAARVPDCMEDPRFDLRFGGRRYRRGAPTTWKEAGDLCSDEGGAHLIVVGDADEDMHAADERAMAGQNMWIGYSDVAAEGEFSWVNGAPAGPPRGYEGWELGQPNDGVEKMNEDCAEVVETGLWHDTDCTALNAFLCECDPSGS